MGKLISIIIPTFNRQALTDKAIESVVTSTPDMLEIIVVDDCSSIQYSYGSQSNAAGVPVRIVRMLENVGAGMARQAGVAQSAGDYIAFLDSDDCYDKGWMDYVVSELLTNPGLLNKHVMFSGIAKGERTVGEATRKMLAAIPTSLRLTAARFVTLLFNPFCTPSIVLHKNLCSFRPKLRHCEDYYSTVVALFQTDILCLPKIVACHLGREPNSIGGASAEWKKMYGGEMSVRWAMLGLQDVRIIYKLFVPVGIIYQWCRTVVKRIFHI